MFNPRAQPFIPADHDWIPDGRDFDQKYNFPWNFRSPGTVSPPTSHREQSATKWRCSPEHWWILIKFLKFQFYSVGPMDPPANGRTLTALWNGDPNPVKKNKPHKKFQSAWASSYWPFYWSILPIFYSSSSWSSSEKPNEVKWSEQQTGWNLFILNLLFPKKIFDDYSQKKNCWFLSILISFKIKKFFRQKC